MSAFMPPSPAEQPSTDHAQMTDLVIGTGIGAISFIIRVICTKEDDRTVWESVVNNLYGTVTASLTALLVGLAAWGYFHNRDLAFAAAGVSAYASPELIRKGLKMLRKA